MKSTRACDVERGLSREVALIAGWVPYSPFEGMTGILVGHPRLDRVNEARQVHIESYDFIEHVVDTDRASVHEHGSACTYSEVHADANRGACRQFEVPAMHSIDVPGIDNLAAPQRAEFAV